MPSSSSINLTFWTYQNKLIFVSSEGHIYLQFASDKLTTSSANKMKQAWGQLFGARKSSFLVVQKQLYMEDHKCHGNSNKVILLINIYF